MLHVIRQHVIFYVAKVGWFSKKSREPMKRVEILKYTRRVLSRESFDFIEGCRAIEWPRARENRDDRDAATVDHFSRWSSTSLDPAVMRRQLVFISSGTISGPVWLLELCHFFFSLPLISPRYAIALNACS